MRLPPPPFAALGFALALLAAPAALAAAAPAPAPPQWPQAKSDLPPDPAVRFGVLANGMRYAVMHNATPAGQTSLRLRVGSGSLEESADEQGLAHVLEHMAFRGSTHVPADEMIRILERKGLAFGPDTNAQTGWTETVYMLDLPRSDADTLGTGLTLLRETAGELSLSDKALSTERGVVLSEERLRDTPDYRAAKAQIDLFLHGQLAADRFPIGKVEVIKTAPVDLVRRFYEANYRPERATLIAVGDFDAADMEARIKALFGDWKAKGAPTAEPDLGQVEKRGTVVKLVQQPGAATRSMIAWVRPYDDTPDTAAKERRETIENLGLSILNRRYEKLAQGADPPFLSAGSGFQNLFHSAKIAVVEASSAPKDWRTALAASEREVRRLVAYGATQGELDREIAEMRAGLVNAVAGAATRPTPALASGLVDTLDDEAVFTAPAGDLAVFDAATKGLTVDKVNAAVREIFAGSGPLVELASPEPVEGGEPEVAKVFAAAQAEAVAATAAEAAVVWPYADFGKPGAIVERGSIPDLGVSTARYANGVRLMVKPTDFRKDQILVSVDIGHGRLDLPLDRPVARWAAGALIEGGLGKISWEDAQRALAGKLYGAGFSIGDDAFRFQGATRPQDLAVQLQLIAAYVADPAYRPQAFEHARKGLITTLDRLSATPDGVFGREAGGLFTRGDVRFTFPTRQALETANPGELKALLDGPFARGRIDVTIVGDVTADQAVALTAATLGALPARAPAPAPAAAAAVRFAAPTAQPVRLTDTGRPDQAIALVAWPARGFFADMKRSRALMVAGDVLENRVLDKVRIAQGATYSPEVRVDLSQTFPDYGYAFALVEMPPPLLPGFFDTVGAIAADLRAAPITADELQRARNPRVANLKKAQLTNEYWLTDLTGSAEDPRRLELIRTTFPDYQALTAADIQAAARDWLKDEKAFRLTIQKGDDAPAAKP